MIFREMDKKLYRVRINSSEEDVFLSLQSMGKTRFLKVDPINLPKSKSPLLSMPEYEISEEGTIVIDLDRSKPIAKQELNRQAKNYILQELSNLDWGNTYEECLAELNSSAQVTETKILYLLKPHKPDLTLTEVRQKIAEYLAKTYTAEDAVKEMQEAGLTEEETQKYLSLLGYAVEVAKLLYWIEEVWDYVEQKEKEIDQATTVEELEKIEIKFPELI